MVLNKEGAVGRRGSTAGADSADAPVGVGPVEVTPSCAPRGNVDPSSELMVLKKEDTVRYRRSGPGAAGTGDRHGWAPTGLLLPVACLL